MLNHLSWTNYFEMCLLVLTIYYLYVGTRFFKPELKNFFKHFSNRKEENYLPDALYYKVLEGKSVSELPGPAETTSPSQTIPSAADQICNMLKTRICIAADKPFAPAVLIDEIKLILIKNKELLRSDEQLKINELIVTECEKTGTALLTEEEVDQWWER